MHAELWNRIASLNASFLADYWMSKSVVVVEVFGSDTSLIQRF
jgi:hypothetical protein